MRWAICGVRAFGGAVHLVVEHITLKSWQTDVDAVHGCMCDIDARPMNCTSIDLEFDDVSASLPMRLPILKLSQWAAHSARPSPLLRVAAKKQLQEACTADTTHKLDLQNYPFIRSCNHSLSANGLHSHRYIPTWIRSNHHKARACWAQQWR